MSNQPLSPYAQCARMNRKGMIETMKEQKSMIRTLTGRSFKKNKSRNLVAVLAITMTAMMFTTLFTLAQSLSKNLTEMYLRQTGTKAHTTAKQITDEQIELLAAHPDVKSCGRSIVLGLAENERLGGRQVEIRYADDQYAKDDFAYPEAGHMPEQKTEIALDTSTLQQLGIPQELGAAVTLEWRKDLFSDQVTSSTFTLCGWWERNHSVYASMAWVSEEFVLEACGGAEGSYEGQILGQRMMGITYADSKNIEEKTERLLSESGISDVEFHTNLAYDPEMQYNAFMETLPMYAGMVLVFLAGYLIIFNVFQISVASDIQFYGKLKTLGMQTKQIKKLIYGQSSRLSLLGIPCGLILGYILGILLIPALIASQDAKPVLSANPVIFIGSALFTWITVMISCLLPARLAGKVSPIEALRYTDTDTEVKRQVKKSKNGASLANMAWSNLGRNRKRTILVLGSLTLGLVLMSYFYAKNASFDVEKYLIDMCVADFQIDDATNQTSGGYDPESNTIKQELVEQITGMESFEASGRLYSRQVPMALSEHTRENLSSYYNQERLDDFASFDLTFPQWKEEYDRALDGKDVPVTVYGADGLILDAAVGGPYIISGTFDAEKFASGNYALAIGPEARDFDTNPPAWTVGESVSIEGREFTIMAVLAPLVPMTEGRRANAFDLPLILSADAYTQIWPDSNLQKYYFNTADAGIEDAFSMLTEYQQNNAPGMNLVFRESLVQQYEAETRSSAVMGYAISVIIALVGVLNFVNSMVTAIISRKREFAMIQSIGMTKRQLRSMLTFEGLYYAGLTLAASYLCGSIVVGVIVRAITSVGYSTFRFTLLPLLICTPILIGLAVLIPYLCFKNLEKQSVVERLRMEA